MLFERSRTNPHKLDAAARIPQEFIKDRGVYSLRDAYQWEVPGIYVIPACSIKLVIGTNAVVIDGAYHLVPKDEAAKNNDFPYVVLNPDGYVVLSLAESWTWEKYPWRIAESTAESTVYIPVQEVQWKEKVFKTTTSPPLPKLDKGLLNGLA